MFYLKRLCYFLMRIPATALDAWGYQDEAPQYSQGRLRDILEFEWMMFQDVITAWSIHWRVHHHKRRK